MTDIEFDNFLNYRPASYYGENLSRSFDQWPGTPFFGPEAVTRTDYVPATGLNDIEHIYTILHRGVDQVAAALSARISPHLDQIREQNRKLIDKLMTLDRAITPITEDPSPEAFDARPLADPCPSGSELDQVRRAGKKRRVSQPIGSEGGPSLRYGSHGRGHSHSRSQRVASLSGSLVSDSKLASKLLQIGTEETRAQVAEFAAQRKTSECQNALPSSCHFSKIPQVTDVAHFLRVVLDLGLAIESSSFGEQNSRIKKRIALARFYNAYTLAQDNPDVFLSWCDGQRVQGGSMLPRGGNKSIVQHRFADLIFSHTEDNWLVPAAHSTDHGDDLKRRIGKIQMWRKSGKKWAQIIQRFGYGILLLLPASLSDEDLRIANDKDLACGLDLIESRKHMFADDLKQANDLLKVHFFSQDRVAAYSTTRTVGPVETADWDHLLHTPTPGNLDSIWSEG
ncbi:hypothetical protein BJX96DRAFT_175480 [Aspergillus floccosus]